MKIGVLLCAYQCEEHLEKVMAPWVCSQKSHDIVISSISCLFKEYQNMSFDKDNSKTKALISRYVDSGAIEFAFHPDEVLTEADARDKPLKYLLNSGCDFVWLLDGDEYYTTEQINKIIKFVEAQKFVNWFGLNFKNIVFDGDVYVDGFCPPRIFRVNIGQLFKLDSFYWDNDVVYKSLTRSEHIMYTDLANINIPKNIAHIWHMTWLNNEKSKRKVAYQTAHFGHCSYKWNDVTNKLEFDESFYKNNNISIPKLFVL